MKLSRLRRLLLTIPWLPLLLITGQLTKAAPPLQNDDSAALVEQGDALLWQSDFSAAEHAYDAAIAADSKYARAYAHRCYLRTFQERFEEAIIDCQQAITLTPDKAEGYIYLTKAYDWSQDFSAALEVGKQAIALVPGNGLAHSFLGEAYLDADQAEAGEKAIRRSVTLAPDDSEVQRGLSYLYSKLKDGEAQLAALEEAIRLAPNFAYYRLELIQYYFAQKTYDQAIKEAQKFLSRYGNIAGADAIHYILVVSYGKQGQVEQARLAAYTLTDTYPDSEYTRIANRFIEQLRRDAAPEADPAEVLQAKTLFNQAKAKANVEAFTEAIPLFQQLVDQYPNNEWADEALFYMGLIHFRLKEYDQARPAFTTL
ncbi:MAG: tetratricopeptide repeat protein, partial [Chloroflexota bacterium]